MDYTIHETRDQNEDDNREEAQEVDRSLGHRLVLPEDGYEWKKYGKKFIKNIRKFRSYFRCQESSCTAKKRAEWYNSDPTNIRIVYEGDHNHTRDGSSSSSAADQPRSGSSNTSSNANRYNLLTQVLGDQPSNSPLASGRI